MPGTKYLVVCRYARYLFYSPFGPLACAVSIFCYSPPFSAGVCQNPSSVSVCLSLSETGTRVVHWDGDARHHLDPPSSPPDHHLDKKITKYILTKKVPDVLLTVCPGHFQLTYHFVISSLILIKPRKSEIQRWLKTRKNILNTNTYKYNAIFFFVKRVLFVLGETFLQGETKRLSSAWCK